MRLYKPMSRLVNVFQAGRMNYKHALALQTYLADSHHEPHLSSECHDTLVLVEHNPVYTTGIRSKSYTVEDEEKLKALGADFHRTNRGGLITFHGPGQLVAYPILDLRHFKPSVRWYVSQIENTVISLCKEFDIPGETSPHTGVWVRGKKICAIGIHGSRYITTHGLALNCNTDLNWFTHIIPCGIEGKGVTSLSSELKQNISVEEITPTFLSSFSKLFDCELCIFPKQHVDRILNLLIDKKLPLDEHVVDSSCY